VDVGGKLSDNGENVFSDNDFDLYVLMDRAKSTISRSCDLEIAAYGITQEQAAIIDTILRANGSATISEIAEQTVKQSNSVATLVNRMVKSGLIKKERPSKNGKYIVSLTDKGKSVYEKVTRNAVSMAFSELSVEEKLMFFTVLNKLMEKARRMLGMDFKMPFLPP
jgi:DNA-binding MarR family transcriptional regulator